MKLDFYDLTLEQAMQLVPAQDLLPWEITAPVQPPSDALQATLKRMQSFEMFTSEAAKILLIDILLLEVVPDHPRLKVGKSATLESETIFGIADYLIAPKRAWVETPLLCGMQAKRGV